MLRKLLLPLAATTLLAGCVTAPYEYRGSGEGGYYYGAPSVEYRYRYGPGYVDPYGPYPYRGGLSVWGSWGAPGYYGYPYYYGNPYYGRPYYGYPRYGHPRPASPRPEARPDGGPWRNIDDIVRRRRAVDGGGGGVPMPRPDVAGPGPGFVPPPPRPAMPRDDGGSPMGEVIRHARKPGTRED